MSIKMEIKIKYVRDIGIKMNIINEIETRYKI